MSHTNSTTNYGLPQFLTGDKPAWLTDINNAFSDIDTAVYAAKSKADTAFTDAGNAQTDATTAINNASAADAKGSGALASIEAAFDPTSIYSVGAKVIYNSLLYRCTVAVVTPGAWTGSDNWERITVDNIISTTDSKIGSLTSLSTTDKTSTVNAINEVNGGLANKADSATTLAGYGITDAVNTSTRVSQTSGNFAGLVTPGHCWLIAGMRATLDAGFMYLVHNYGSTMHVSVIHQDTGFSYVTNSTGTIVINYSGSDTSIYACAYQLC